MHAMDSVPVRNNETGQRAADDMTGWITYGGDLLVCGRHSHLGSSAIAIAPPGHQDESEMRAGLTQHLARLWRYALVLSGNRDIAEDLVQATCARAAERPDQFAAAGSRLDRWLFSILHSIWLNEHPSRAQELVDAELVSVIEGAGVIETNVLARQVLKEVELFPHAQRETLFLVYVEGLTYREAAEVLHVPIATVMSRLATARMSLGKTTLELPTTTLG